MKIFIASSQEARKDAERVSTWLRKIKLKDDTIVPVLWDDPIAIPVGSSILESLLTLAESVDAAVFIFGDDDSVECRGRKLFQPRDNVLIEFGIFLERLGSKNAIICGSGDVKLAADVRGIRYVTLDPQDDYALSKKHVESWASQLPHHCHESYSPWAFEKLRSEIEKTKREIKILTTWLPDSISLVQSLEKSMQTNKDCRVDILMLDPKSKFADDRARDLDRGIQEVWQGVSGSLRELDSLVRRIPSVVDRLRVRLYHDCVPTLIMFQVDKRVAFAPFLNRIHGMHSPLVAVSGDCKLGENLRKHWANVSEADGNSIVTFPLKRQT